MAKVGATEFKARCLELMDRVAERRDSYVITKRGRPVAKLVPADPPADRSVFGCMAAEMEIVGAVDEPAWSDQQWQEFEREREAQRRAWDRDWRSREPASRRRSAGPTRKSGRTTPARRSRVRR
jgi:prevent-host-death family protein